MDTPTNYNNVCQKALDAKQKYNLTDVQTLLYNHICRGDFKLRNEDGQLFYDKNNNGFGWHGDRNWVKRQFKPLIKEGLVKFEFKYDCRDSHYTSWYFYDPTYNFDDLIDASCYVSTWKLFMIKHYLNLPDGFDKNAKYGDIEFIRVFEIFSGGLNHPQYTFKYKGEESIYSWDHNGNGIKQDLTWLTKQPTWPNARWYSSFADMIHDVWSFLAHDGYSYNIEIPNTTTRRIFSI